MKSQGQLNRMVSNPRSGKRMLVRLAQLFLAAGWLGFYASPAAIANKPELQIITNADLRFGAFAVPTRGFREISPSGSIISAGIFALNDSGTGPARFTVQYDRGNNGRRRLDLVIELVLSAPSTFTNGGLTAQLSRYQTDLPGYSFVQPGQVIRIEMPNCTQRVCSTSFNLGGRLDVERSFGGGPVVIPIPADAVLVSVR